MNSHLSVLYGLREGSYWGDLGHLGFVLDWGILARLLFGLLGCSGPIGSSSAFCKVSSVVRWC